MRLSAVKVADAMLANLEISQDGRKAFAQAVVNGGGIVACGTQAYVLLRNPFLAQQPGTVPFSPTFVVGDLPQTVKSQLGWSAKKVAWYFSKIAQLTQEDRETTFQSYLRSFAITLAELESGVAIGGPDIGGPQRVLLNSRRQRCNISRSAKCLSAASCTA